MNRKTKIQSSDTTYSDIRDGNHVYVGRRRGDDEEIHKGDRKENNRPEETID